MQVKIELSTEQVNLILKGLGELPHKLSRQLIDYLLNEYAVQERDSKVVAKISEEQFKEMMANGQVVSEIPAG